MAKGRPHFSQQTLGSHKGLSNDAYSSIWWRTDSGSNERFCEDALRYGKLLHVVGLPPLRQGISRLPTVTQCTLDSRRGPDQHPVQVLLHRTLMARRQTLHGALATITTESLILQSSLKRRVALRMALRGSLRNSNRKCHHLPTLPLTRMARAGLVTVADQVPVPCNGVVQTTTDQALAVAMIEMMKMAGRMTERARSLHVISVWVSLCTPRLRLPAGSHWHGPAMRNSAALPCPILHCQ